MYVPAHFAAEDQDVRQLLTHHGAADLITHGPAGLEATMLPFVYDADHGVVGSPRPQQRPLEAR